MPTVKQSTVGMNYLDPAAFGFDPAGLKPGDKARGGKSWQHELVEGGGGGWFEADAPGTPVSLPSADTPAAGGDGGDGGGLGGFAMGGLQSAREPLPSMTHELPAPGAGNPALGQRLYPMAMRQLAAQAPKVY